ncbi:hypothetical protein LUZ60_013032 [Juncus effusus]|nr:hypothetical protein LUZ60_013032 [Juncus effusus]
MEISSGYQQTMSTLPLEEILISCPKPAQPPHQQQHEKKPRPNPDQTLNCPRCDSTNTKFCYYNNYSLSQPRYFCKACRRYWTKGGSLRNVPVGGGSRKNKRLNSNLNTNRSSFLKKPLESNPVFVSDQSFIQHDLSLQLAFARLHGSGLMVGNPNPNPSYGCIDALYENGLMRGFYGFGGAQEANNNVGSFESGAVSSVREESVNTAAIEGSPCKTFNGDERKGLIGLNQWQLGGDGLSIGMDYGRENFDGFSSNNYFHGLISKSHI